MTVSIKHCLGLRLTFLFYFAKRLQFALGISKLGFECAFYLRRAVVNCDDSFRERFTCRRCLLPLLRSFAICYQDTICFTVLATLLFLDFVLVVAFLGINMNFIDVELFFVAAFLA